MIDEFNKGGEWRNVRPQIANLTFFLPYLSTYIQIFPPITLSYPPPTPTLSISSKKSQVSLSLSPSLFGPARSHSLSRKSHTPLINIYKCIYMYWILWIELIQVTAEIEPAFELRWIVIDSISFDIVIAAKEFWDI